MWFLFFLVSAGAKTYLLDDPNRVVYRDQLFHPGCGKITSLSCRHLTAGYGIHLNSYGQWKYFGIETRIRRGVQRFNSTYIQGTTFTLGEGSGCQPPTPPFGYQNNVGHYHQVVILGQFWGYGFYHFLLESFSRLADIKLEEYPEAYYIIACSRTTVRYEEYLELLGVRKEKIVCLNEGDSIYAEDVIFPEETVCGRPQPSRLLAMREKFRDVFNPSQPKVKILLVQPLFRFANLEQLYSQLLGVDPSWVLVGELPAQDNINLWSRAEVVVTVGGERLASLLFAPIGTRILEYFPDGRVIPIYGPIADALGHHWTGLIITVNEQGELPVTAEQIYLDLKETFTRS